MRCWVWWPVVVCCWRVSVSVSLSGRVVCFPVVGVVCCGTLLPCVVFCGAVLSRGAVLLCSAVVLRCCWWLLCPPVSCRTPLCCAVGWVCFFSARWWCLRAVVLFPSCCVFPVLSALCVGVPCCTGALALRCWCGVCCCWRLVLWCVAVCCAVFFGTLWCGAGCGGPWLSAGGVFRCRCPCLAAWSASLWLVRFAVVPCFPVSCAMVLCCCVVLCSRALLSLCGAVCACFALLWPVARRPAVLCCAVGCLCCFLPSGGVCVLWCPFPPCRHAQKTSIITLCYPAPVSVSVVHVVEESGLFVRCCCLVCRRLS